MLHKLPLAVIRASMGSLTSVSAGASRALAGCPELTAAAATASNRSQLPASIFPSGMSTSDFKFYSTSNYRGGDAAPGPGPGPRTRSMEQSSAAGETSTTSGDGPARSPDAPADPADLQGNRGSNPDEALRTAAGQADQSMAGSYQNYPGPDTGGSFTQHVPGMASRLAEKVSSAADIAAQAATGAASVMSDTVKAATGAAVGVKSGHRGSVPHPSGGDEKDQSPVSDDSSFPTSQYWVDTNSDTRGFGQGDTAGGTADEDMLKAKTEQGGYKEAANRLMDAEGLPRKY